MLDNLITLQQRKLDSLKKLKKGCLQKLFPKNSSLFPEVRFPGFTAPWEQRKLSELSTSFSGGTPKVGVANFYGGNIPFIRSGEIQEDKTELSITHDGLENSSAKLVEKGDILYALYGATSGEVSRSRISGAINQAVLAIRVNKGVSPEFIHWWLRKSKTKIVSTYLQGGQGNLSAEIIKNLCVDLPSLEEQKKIGFTLREINDLITLQQRKIETMKNLKKYLLQNMFV